MIKTENLLLGMLFAAMLYLPATAYCQVYTPEPAHYQGRYNGEPVELLVEFIEDVPLVLLFWSQRESVYRLRVQDNPGFFQEYELFTKRPTRRQWRLAISTNEVTIVNADGRAAILSRQNIQSSPESIASIRRTTPASQVAFFQLCRQFTGIRYDLLSYGGSAVADALIFDADDASFIQRPANVFGTGAPELIMELRLNSFIHVVRVFQKVESSWQLTPSALLFKRNTRDDEPCLTEPPGPGYFYFDFAEVLRPGESVIYGYTYDGHCANIYRGDKIFFYVWQSTPGGFRELFRAPVRQYWYASPDPAPIAPPVYQEFEFVPAAGQRTFPKRLRKREAIFLWPEGVERGKVLKPVDFRTEYIHFL